MKKKNFFQFILSLLVLVLISSNTAFSLPINTKKANCLPKIITTYISDELDNYSKKQFLNHLAVINQEPEGYGFTKEETMNFTLGIPFRIYTNNTDNIFWYPVLCNNKIKGILEVLQTEDGEFASTFAKGFAEKLQEILENKLLDKFKIISIDGNLMAINDNICVSIYSKGNLNLLEKNKFVNKIFKNVNNINEYLVDITSPEANFDCKKMILRGSSDIKKQASFNISIVSQMGKNWCWAASCAAIINYYTGAHLNAQKVVEYTFGRNVDTGGTGQQMLNAYKHWGLSAESLNRYIKYDELTGCIEYKVPIHMRLSDGKDGHSMVLRGYTEFNDSSVLYSAIDPNKSDYVSIIGSKSTNKSYYTISGSKLYWENSILATYH